MSIDVFMLIAVIVLIFCYGFFSGSETSLMSLNRYRVRHLAKQEHRSAKTIIKFLKRPDRILGVILLGNTFVNILAAALATVLAERWFGQLGILVSTISLTLIVLIFAEIMPKTLAALYPERFAFPASPILKFLLWLLYPIVWIANFSSNSLLKLFGTHIPKELSYDPLTKDELHSAIDESNATLTRNYRNMLLGILELDTMTVSDVMLPRKNIEAVNLNQSSEEIVNDIVLCFHRNIILYREHIENTFGVLNAHHALRQFNQKDKISKADILKLIEEPCYTPETTSLQTQLLNFQKQGERLGIVVDEYGAIKGIVTVEDIIEEIVGEFSDTFKPSEYISQLSDGSYLVSGSITIRELNRHLNLKLLTKGPNTLSGLITEYLEAIPSAPCCFKTQGYMIEVTKINHNIIEKARIYPLSTPPS